MSGENQKGFTIIETTLFLAVSALLFISLFGGISLAVQRQRYSDSVNSTHSFLQKQFNETLNVVNNRDDDQCAPNTATIGASSCIVMGRAIQLHPATSDSDKIETFTIIGEDPDLPDGQEAKITDYNPRIIDNDNNAQEYLIPWAAQITAAQLLTTPTATNINTIILLRYPESGATFLYAVNSPPINTALDDSYINEDSRIDSDHGAVVCLHSQDITSAYARINFTGSGSQDGVLVDFDQASNCGL
ncbi:hypothetical protein KC939_02620 [Candidatus Saccharibacteria bacterium]|nr:hypothetical protein [Candidatus Saccharibacteria bacterium]